MTLMSYLKLHKEYLMKNTLLAVALTMFGFASVASAENFTNNMVTTTMTVDNYELSVTGTVTDNIALGSDFEIYGSVDTLDHTIAYWDANVEFTVGYANIADNDVAIVSAAYQLETTTGDMTLTAEVATSYIALTNDLSGGKTIVSPTVGVSYAATDTISLFSDVSYGWAASNDFADMGGTVEAGVVVAVTDTVDVGVSAVRSFATTANETQAALEVTFNF
jgi:hypothetical protein